MGDRSFRRGVRSTRPDSDESNLFSKSPSSGFEIPGADIYGGFNTGGGMGGYTLPLPPPGLGLGGLSVPGRLQPRESR
jgi:hypothetical protein